MNKILEKAFIGEPNNTLEYNDLEKKAYGIKKLKKSTKFLSIDLEDRKEKSFEINTGSLQLGLNALDKKNNKYFFIETIKEIRYFNVVNCNLGRIETKKELKNPFIIFQYDEETNKILGIQKIKNKNFFVKYDFQKNKIIKKEELRDYYKIMVNKPLIHKNKFIFFCNVKNNNSMMSIDLKDYKTKKLNSKLIKIDEHEIFSYDDKTHFTLGVQTCLAIIGQNKDSKINLLAHFSPNNKEINKKILQIKKELKKEFSEELKNMKIQIIGGIKNKKESYENVLLTYKELKKQGVKIIVKNHNHLQKTYNILIKDDELITN